MPTTKKQVSNNIITSQDATKAKINQMNCRWEEMIKITAKIRPKIPTKWKGGLSKKVKLPIPHWNKKENSHAETERKHSQHHRNTKAQ